MSKRKSIFMKAAVPLSVLGMALTVNAYAASPARIGFDTPHQGTKASYLETHAMASRPIGMNAFDRVAQYPFAQEIVKS